VIPRLSWSTIGAIGAIGVTALAIVAMFFDHMVDVEEPFPSDPPAFAISAVLILVLAAIVFGVVVPRTLSAPAPADLAGKRGLVCSILSVLSLPGIWLGLPFVLAGGGITLGIVGRRGRRRRMALAAIAIGVIVLVLGIVGTDWGSDG
jgi:hypothetical protein